MSASHAATLEYGIGADLSFLKQQEDAGKRFKDQGQILPGLEIFRKHGYGWIRLRLFHTLSNSQFELPNTLAYTLASAKSAKAKGFRLLLDFHYSDTWADPGNQQVPMAWAGLPHANLIDSVQAYTRDVIARFGAEGILPDMVQIGNEINNGMMWPDGKDDWNNLADLGRNLGFMAGRYAKDIIVVETAFTPYPADQPGGGSPFPLTDAGQADFYTPLGHGLPGL